MEAERRQLFDELRKLTPQQLAHKSEPQRWSVIQVLEHVLQAERGSLAYIRKKNQAESLPKSGIGAWLRSTTLQLALRSPFRFPVPEVMSDPANDRSLPEIGDQWEKCREGLTALLKELPDSRIKVLLYRHPIAGYLNILQALNFLHAHFSRHAGQIYRILAQQKFPANSA